MSYDGVNLNLRFAFSAPVDRFLCTSGSPRAYALAMTRRGEECSVRVDNHTLLSLRGRSASDRRGNPSCIVLTMQRLNFTQKPGMRKI